jgi:hypothetical protein
MRVLVRAGASGLIAASVLIAGSGPGSAQTPPGNQVVINAQFQNGPAPDDEVLSVRVVCANQGGETVETVVDETVTFDAQFDPITIDVPFLAGPATFVGCEVHATATSATPALISYHCAVRTPGTHEPSDPAPFGCNALRPRVDVFFPAMVSGAVVDVTVLSLLSPPPPSSVIVLAPNFTG